MLKKAFICLLTISLFTLLTLKNALSCACGCGVFNVGTSALIPNCEGGVAFLQYDQMNQTQNWRKENKSDGHNHDKNIRTDTVTAGAQYMFNRSFGAAVRLPYLTRYTESVPHSGKIMSSRHSDIGDVRINGIYSGIFDDMSTGLILGLKLPTGSTKTKDLSRNQQIGTGSTDSILGAYHVGKIDEEVFQQLKNMFDSSDNDNHVLAMEIMANSKYEDSVLYLLMLISENAYKINNSNTRNHVNFKSMLTYFGWQPRDVSHQNTDDIVQIIDKKGLLTVDMIKRLYQEYSEDIVRNIYYDDVFEVKEVTIKQEYLEKLNLTCINLINPEEDTISMQPDPVEIEEEVLEDELIEAAFTNIERKELKSELITLEEEILAEKDLATFKEEESNNHQTNSNESTDIDWF